MVDHVQDHSFNTQFTLASGVILLAALLFAAASMVLPLI